MLSPAEAAQINILSIGLVIVIVLESSKQPQVFVCEFSKNTAVLNIGENFRIFRLDFWISIFKLLR